MEALELFGILFEGCGVFDSSDMPRHNSISAVHKTTRYEIELPFEKGGINNIDGVDREIDTDTLFFIKPNSTRFTVYPFKCLSLHFSTKDSNLNKVLEDIPTFITLQNRNEIFSLFFKMVCIFSEHPPHFEISFISTFFELIHLILKESSPINNIVPTIKLPVNAVKQAKNYIDTNYQNKITYEEICNAVNLSPVYLQRIFTAATGKSPHKYLLDKRLQIAKELLLLSNHNLTEISNMCGFSSQSRFNVVFKQIEGVTPTEYKKKNRIKNY